MEIIIGKYAGFCNGAKNAVIKTNEALNKDKLYSIGDIIHNEEVVNYLKERGLIVKNSIDEIPDDANIIIRAHGEGIKFYQEAKRKNLNVTDLTCRRVKLVHNKILNKKNSFIIIVGKKSHPEVIAHKSYSDTSSVVEDQSDINVAYDKYLRSGKNSVYVVAQTTFNGELFNELVNEIRNVFKNTIIEVDNTICDATNKRQKEAREIASKVDKVIVIGGKNSSNTKELATEASKCCPFVYLIQNKNDLKEIEFSKDDVVGITAGASTPDNLINEVVEYLNHVYNKIK